jgi:hypothetical protein
MFYKLSYHLSKLHQIKKHKWRDRQTSGKEIFKNTSSNITNLDKLFVWEIEEAQNIRENSGDNADA